ncbi:UNVERIFIED_CONTAM: CRISPR-associated endoribonuclease Cas6 [Acetivibrio alkalicellulosi]
MKYYELTATAHLNEDIAFDYAGAEIGHLLSRTMLKLPELRRLHKENTFKHYCFGSFFPIEKEKVYKKGNVYTFKVRTLNEDFSECVRKNIKSIKDSKINILAVEASQRNRRYLSNIYSVTPVVVTLDENKRWTKEEGFLYLTAQLKSNLEKKFRTFYGEEIESSDDAINRIELMNKKPMIVNYKNTRILGNKFKIWFNENEDSQKLAFVAMSCGLGEKNTSVGAGFCMGGQDG